MHLSYDVIMIIFDALHLQQKADHTFFLKQKLHFINNQRIVNKYLTGYLFYNGTAYKIQYLQSIN